MKLLTDASEYALRAVVWMGQAPDRSWKVREIATATKAAPGYLVKVLQQLARAGLLSAQRGSSGGYTMLRSPFEVTIADVIDAVDPIERIERCPLGLAAHAAQLCPLHRRIDAALGQIEDTFRSITIADLIQESADSPAQCEHLTNGASSGATLTIKGSVNKRT